MHPFHPEYILTAFIQIVPFIGVTLVILGAGDIAIKRHIPAILKSDYINLHGILNQEEAISDITLIRGVLVVSRTVWRYNETKEVQEEQNA